MVAPPEARKSSVWPFSRQMGSSSQQALETSLVLLDVFQIGNSVQSFVNVSGIAWKTADALQNTAATAQAVVVKQSKGKCACRRQKLLHVEILFEIVVIRESISCQSFFDRPASLRKKYAAKPDSFREERARSSSETVKGRPKRLHIGYYADCMYSILASQGDINTYYAGCAHVS